MLSTVESLISQCRLANVPTIRSLPQLGFSFSNVKANFFNFGWTGGHQLTIYTSLKWMTSDHLRSVPQDNHELF
jgi:hypothetical protein